MRKLVWFTLPFALAAAICVYWITPTWGFVLGAAALLGLAAVLFTHGRRRAQAAVALAGICAGFLFCAGYELLFLEPIRACVGQTAEITATVSDYPTDTAYGCRVTGRLTLNGREVDALLYLGQEARDVQPGDRVRVTAELRRSDVDRDGDTLLYYQGKGIRVIACSRGEASVSHTAATPLREWPVVFSERLREILERTTPADCTGLLQALLTGDKSNLSYARRSDLTMAGVSHTIAISGMHVTMLLALLSILLRRNRRLVALLGIPVIVFFVFATGCSPSVIRAAVMQCLFLIAPFFRRDSDAPTSLCAAMLLILLQNPYAIANVSFQLSFAAMAGILLFTGRLYRRIAARGRLAVWLKHEKRKPGLGWQLRRVRRALLVFVIGSICTTLGALALTTPILALCFGAVAPYALLSNLLVLWSVGVCFGGAIAAALLGWIFLPLGQLVGLILALPVRYLFWVAHGVSRLPFAALSLQSPYVVVWLILSYLFLGLGLAGRRVLLPTAGVLGTLLAAMLLTRLDARPSVFYVTALDVGQGQSIAMLTRDYAALYDCGGSDGDAAGQHAAEYLLNAGVRRLDALVISHYDEDHVGGTAQLLYRVAVDTIYLPDVDADNVLRAEIEALAAHYGSTVCYVHEPVRERFAAGSLTVYPPVSEASDNAGSLSILFSADGYELLATGDMDVYAEELLLHSYLLPDVELYLAGHHGSKYSSGTALLEAIRPETALVSVGENRYGHPSEEALARLTAAGAEVFRTDQCGDIRIGR